jgi:thioredoxin 1
MRNAAANIVRRTLCSTQLPSRSCIRPINFVNKRQHQFVQQSRAFATSPQSRVHTVDDDEELRTVLSANPSGLVIVDWSASWCGPCRAVAPYYDELSAMPENESVTFVKADIDELPDASREAGVEAVPTFHFIKGNKIVAQLQGANMNRLKDLLEQHR